MSSIQVFFLDFWNFFNFAKPLNYDCESWILNVRDDLTENNKTNEYVLRTIQKHCRHLTTNTPIVSNLLYSSLYSKNTSLPPVGVTQGTSGWHVIKIDLNKILVVKLKNISLKKCTITCIIVNYFNINVD